MPHPSDVGNDVTSPYDAGLSYFPDEYATPDGGAGDASRLGFFLIDDALAAAGLISTVKGAAGSIASLFGGGGTATDAARQARVQTIYNYAVAGNVAAARILLAGPSNVAADEAGYWNTAINTLQTRNANVLQAARTAGPLWFPGSGDTATNYPTLMNAITTWANANSLVTPAGVGLSGVVGSLTRNPVLLVGGLAAAYFVMRKR